MKTLSDKRQEDCIDGFYHEKDVKQFIKDLKKELTYPDVEPVGYWSVKGVFRMIDKLAGDKLIEEKQALTEKEKEYSNIRELNDDLKSGKIRYGETIVLDERKESKEKEQK